MKKLILILILFSIQSFSQSHIVTGGSLTETFGGTFIIIEPIDTIVKEEVYLGIPKYEIPKEEQKPIKVKKKNFIQKLLEFIKQLFN